MEARKSILLTNVYRVGTSEPFFSLVCHDQFGPVNWWEKQIVIADYFQCDADDVATIELSDGTECITVNGCVVGSFDHAVELRQLLVESAGASVRQAAE